MTTYRASASEEAMVNRLFDECVARGIGVWGYRELLADLRRALSE